METALIILVICFVAYVVFSEIRYRQMAEDLDELIDNHDALARDHNQMSAHYERFTLKAIKADEMLAKEIEQTQEAVTKNLTDWANGANKNNEQFCKEIDDLKKFAIRKDAEYANQHGHDFDEEEK